MSAETNKAIARRIYEAFNTRNLEVLDMLVHPDFVDHYPDPEQKPGVEGIRKVWTQIWARFPDVHIVVEDMLAEGDKVATRLTLHITPDTKEVTRRGRVFEIFRVVDGKVLELWNIIKWLTPG